jgi:hypothetical protein
MFVKNKLGQNTSPAKIIFRQSLNHILRRKGKCDGVMLEVIFMRAIAKWFIFRKTATANGDYFPSSQIILGAGFVDNLKISLNFQ